MQDSRGFAAPRHALLAVALVLLACSDQGPDTTGDVRGTIRDSEGTNLAGVVVRASLVGAAALQAVSAADGTFALHNMRAGVWQLRYDGSDAYEERSIPVTVKAGSSVNVTMVITRRSYGAISGTIRDAEGASLAGVTIRASLDGATTQEAISAADGTFTFASMRTGLWQLTYDGSVDYGSKSVVIAVTADATADVTMVVDVRGTIRGVIRYNDTEQPAAGVQVRLIGHGTVRDTITLSDGTFRFMRVTAGVLTLVIIPPAGYRGDTAAVAFDGSARYLPLVTLVRVSSSVVGSVRSAMGGVSDVTVHLTHMESGTHQTGTTRADGSFTIDEVPVGTVRLSVDPTPEAFAVPVVMSVQEASVVAAAIALLPRSALRPIAYVRCLQWETNWDDEEYCAQRWLSVVNSDGTGVRTVHDEAAGITVYWHGSRPSWSPDGQQLVFSGQLGSLYLINVSGSGLVQLSPFAGMLTPVWSPDGDRILFAGSQSFSPLYFGMLPGFGITAVPNTEGAAEPALSPDGRRIAFTAGGALKVANTDGSGLVTLISSGASHPTWSPDGQRIAFSQVGNIWIIGANGGNPVSLGPGSCPEWSPDGSLIAVFGRTEPLYLDDVVVASLSIEDAIWCTQAWSPVAALMP